MLALTAGCGGQKQEPVERTWHREPPGAGAADAGLIPGTTPSTTGPQSSGKTSAEPSEVFDDPGCPEVSKPEPTLDCDPWSTGECPDGYACSPYVDYPDEPCETEHYGTGCRVAGAGVQGDSCVIDDCAAGFLCIASGQGTVCAQLCLPDGSAKCAPGFICGTVDLDGYGVCF
jgi:hypothetical protein